VSLELRGEISQRRGITLPVESEMKGDTNRKEKLFPVSGFSESSPKPDHGRVVLIQEERKGCGLSVAACPPEVLRLVKEENWLESDHRPPARGRALVTPVRVALA
jgi:Na+-translocating ferredoxin:NAD+ oxidoreductase RNF subunit RnfB